MKIPTFTFDEGANGYLSEPMEIDDPILVKIELASVAPVVITSSTTRICLPRKGSQSDTLNSP